MEDNSRTISLKLKVAIAILALVMPVTGALSGWYYGVFIAESNYPYLVALLCLVLGVALDVVCYYDRLFTFVFYKMPIPGILFVIAYEAASFFYGRWVSLGFAFAGLAIGVFFDYVLLAPKPFYMARKRLLVVVYIFLSIIMLGVMSGVPVSNFFLGILAGNYFSLRYAGAVLGRDRLHKNLYTMTIFATVVLLVSELLFAWLVWQDSVNIIDYLNSLLGIAFTRQSLLWLMVILGVVSVVVQFVLTFTTGMILYRYRSHKKIYSTT
jgi:hypothetical protein